MSIARGFTLSSSSSFLSSPPARILLFRLRLLLLLFSCCSSSVCGEPQIIRINIITSSGAASLFLSPRSTHHDVTHDRFRAPVKPPLSSSSSSPQSSTPFAFLPTVDSFYLAAVSCVTNSTDSLEYSLNVFGVIGERPMCNLDVQPWFSFFANKKNIIKLFFMVSEDFRLLFITQERYIKIVIFTEI